MRSHPQQRGILAAVATAVLLVGCAPASHPASPPPAAPSTSADAATAAPAPLRASATHRHAVAPPSTDDEPHAHTAQRPLARAAAGRFFASYLAFLTGRLTASRVAGVDPNVRWELSHARANPTPAQRAAHPRIRRLTVSSGGPPVSVTATAVIADAPGAGYRLTATLEPRHGAWRVVAIGE
jgi:hypothetical protein